MKNITFLGAAGDVTGSCFLVTADDGSQFLVDLGMFQGGSESVEMNYKQLDFNPAKLTGVFLTHAHLDHCGRLPLLVFGGFRGKIYMTAPTASLIDLSLNDAAHVAKNNYEYPPLYDTDQVEKTLKMVEVVGYDHEFNVGNIQVTYKNAGHILGSSSIEFVDAGGQKIVFSGDLGNSPEDIVKPTEYIATADIVVMESTYGDKDHPVDNPGQIIQEEINQVEKSGGVLLIPAFSLERTQEVLHRINHLKKEGKVLGQTPVFLDSPMGIHATSIFRDFKDFYNDELRSHTDDPFTFEGLTVTEEARDSKEIIKAMNPKVIIAGSGMMSGGRMLHHAVNYLSDKNTRVLFVGYQAEETLGRKILNGAKSVRIGEAQVVVRASVREIESLSSHADQQKLLVWLQHIKGVKKVFLVHGEQRQREMLSDKIKVELGISDIILPGMGEEVEI